MHYEYKADARKAHDGTIEYTSRDAHIGAHSRRSDLEILAYNLVHWMSGDLPWMDKLTDPKYVQAQKQGYLNDVKAFLQRCFQSEDYPCMYSSASIENSFSALSVENLFCPLCVEIKCAVL